MREGMCASHLARAVVLLTLRLVLLLVRPVALPRHDEHETAQQEKQKAYGHYGERGVASHFRARTSPKCVWVGQ